MVNSADILNARILVVDDQEAYVLLLERMLQGAGYASVRSTTDPAQVCDLHRQHHFDLILLDLQMPGMNGFQVMESLKAMDSGDSLPVLVLTAQPDHKAHALTAGAKDFVSKPFDHAEVLIRVHNLLEVRLLQLETRALRERLQALQQAQERQHLKSERVLHTLLPPAIAQRFQGLPGLTSDSVKRVIEQVLLQADQGG